MPPSVHPATVADLAATAILHARHLDSGLFPRLGPRFLRRYHATFLDSPHGVGLVARQDDDVVAFLFGTTANRAHYRWVVNQEWWALAWRGALGLLLRPHVALLFLRTRVRRYAKGIRRRASAGGPTAGTDAGADSSQQRRIAVLSHVACADHVQGQGVGRALVESFLARARRAGATEARLITAYPGPAANFYKRLGWQAVRDRRARDGNTVREYRMPLNEVQPA